MISTLSKKHSFNTVYDTQIVFRLILKAMSYPMRVVNIKKQADKLYGDYSVLLAVAMTLLDNEVSFNTCQNSSLGSEIASLTLAKREQVQLSDFVFICQAQDVKGAIENVKFGTLADPHKSATVVILNDEKPLYWLKFSGPGIDGCTSLHASQTVKDALAFRDKQSYEYPQGIDLLFVSSAGDLMATPRLTRMEVV